MRPRKRIINLVRFPMSPKPRYRLCYYQGAWALEHYARCAAWFSGWHKTPIAAYDTLVKMMEGFK